MNDLWRIYTLVHTYPSEIVYLNISSGVQAVVKEKPGGICVVWLAGNPKVKVASTGIQLLGYAHLLWSKDLAIQSPFPISLRNTFAVKTFLTWVAAQVWMILRRK